MTLAPSHASAVWSAPRKRARAGFVSRVVAFLADVVLISAGLLIGALVVRAVETFFLGGLNIVARGTDAGTWASIRAAMEAVAIVLAVLLVLAYPIVFWTLAGMTPGKALMGLRVIRADGAPVTARRATLRCLAYWVSALPLFLGFAWILVDDERRAWHDHIAGTTVIYVSRRAPATVREATARSPGAVH